MAFFLFLNFSHFLSGFRHTFLEFVYILLSRNGHVDVLEEEWLLKNISIQLKVINKSFSVFNLKKIEKLKNAKIKNVHIELEWQLNSMI